MTEEISEQSKPTPLGVCIMPWAGLRQEVKIGAVRFWLWDESKVSDLNVRNQLNKFFSCFVDHHGEPVKTITICSHGHPDFRMLSKDAENEDLHSAVDILVFSSIGPQVKRAVATGHRCMAPPSSDRYQIITQRVNPGDKMIALRAGDFGGGFWDIDEVRISQPWGMGGEFGIEPDRTLITALGRVFENGFPSEVKERMLRSLEWFKLAHAETEQISIFSKVVMMGTAFEILLDFPDRGQKSEFFVEQMETKIRKSDFVVPNRARKGSDGKDHSYSQAGWWAWDFYQLRNKIVHGNKMDIGGLRYKNWITHNIVADVAFLQFMKMELLNNGCFSAESQRSIIDFDDAHRALGWISKKEEGGTDGQVSKTIN